jgi:hypothetical protein
MKQFLITPAAGKRLIGRAMVSHPAIRSALESGTVAILAGTTNGYVAEELLSSIGQVEGFSRKGFIRGVTLPPLPPGEKRAGEGAEFPGDVIITGGRWEKGKTIFDVVDDLKEGDAVLKGANALDPVRKQAAIYIGHPKAGTIGVSLQAAAGRRVRLILPVGLEKRTFSDLMELATRLNVPGVEGPRLLPVPGEVFTELDAVSLLTGAQAELVAAGGVCGAEGSVWIAVSGTAEQVMAAQELLKSVAFEPPFGAR